MSAVAASYLRNWDGSRYNLRYVTTWSSHQPSMAARCVQALKAWGACCFALLSWRPDIVHIHFTHRGSFYRKAGVLVLTRVLTNAKIVLHCHASQFPAFYQGRSTVLKGLVRRILSAADLLVVVAAHWSEYFRSLCPDLSPLVMYNPVDVPSSVPAQADREHAILTLGVLGERKGTYDILRAVPVVLAADPDARFWLGGDGEVETVAAALAEVPWGSSVRLLDWVEGSLKEAYLDRAAVFLLPSYAEGLPVAVLEAMAHGLAVITTPVGGLPDAIEHGDTGIFVQPGDVAAIAAACVELLRDEGRRACLGSNARRRAQDQFEVGRVLEKLYQAYDRLLSGSGQASSKIRS
jgi:glycosyltransferase involved in cell wall biosynthesis